jgi:alpha-mannosidase
LIDKSFVECVGENVAIDWVKIAEDGSGVIVRAYEFAGKNANVNISLNEMFGDKKVYICDLMENVICETDGNVSFTPYEIHTIKFI